MGETQILPAATLLLVRDASAGLEVFMVKRHHAIDFVPGAMVFPGGKVDPDDSHPALAAACRGTEGLAADAVALRVAAIRESFEECGILLARSAGSEALVDEARARAIDDSHRAALCEGERCFSTIVADEALELAGDLPVHFAHWITPDVMPKRFDTHFFLVETPAGQSAVHDGGESVDSVWITPQAAIAAEEAGSLDIIFPTLMQLKKLARYATVSEAVEATRSAPVVTVLPRIEQGENGPTLHIPAEADYGLSEAPVDALFKKFPGKKPKA
jgi:8-oxo-dGTP pyrophosphatase MutT (NUDIX family)